MRLFSLPASVRLLALLLAGLFQLHATAAQGVQTGDIRGVVTDATGGVVPGATITFMSPALQGVRSATTDRQGGYIVRGLPPGTYTASYALTGFGTAERTIEVPLGAVVQVDVTLTAAQVTEQVNVVAQADSIVRQPQVSTNITKETVDVLPIGRTPFGKIGRAHV